jgi:hypothetical protein
MQALNAERTSVAAICASSFSQWFRTQINPAETAFNGNAENEDSRLLEGCSVSRGVSVPQLQKLSCQRSGNLRYTHIRSPSVRVQAVPTPQLQKLSCHRSDPGAVDTRGLGSPSVRVQAVPTPQLQKLSCHRSDPGAVDTRGLGSPNVRVQAVPTAQLMIQS